MGAKYSSVSVSGYNSSPPADDGSVASSNQVQWQKHLDKIGAPLKTAIEAVNTAIVAEVNRSARSVSSDDTAVAGDHNRTIEIASTSSPAVTITLSDAATMTAGYVVTIANLCANYAATITRATGADTINGTAADITLLPNSAYHLLVNTAADGYLVLGVGSPTFRDIPQNPQSADYTLIRGDAGKYIYHPSTDANNRTFTIPANASVAYPLSTVIRFVNLSANNLTIAITSDIMYLAGSGTTGSRTLAQYGVATALKIATASWIIDGTGLT